MFKLTSEEKERLDRLRRVKLPSISISEEEFLLISEIEKEIELKSIYEDTFILNIDLDSKYRRNR